MISTIKERNWLISVDVFIGNCSDFKFYDILKESDGLIENLF